MGEQEIDGSRDIPTGEDMILSASFDKDGEEPPGEARAMLARE